MLTIDQVFEKISTIILGVDYFDVGDLKEAVQDLTKEEILSLCAKLLELKSQAIGDHAKNTEDLNAAASHDRTFEVMSTSMSDFYDSDLSASAIAKAEKTRKIDSAVLCLSNISPE